MNVIKSENLIRLVGYHGTTIKNAMEIVQENKFVIKGRDNHWLGQGVYFFENDKELAGIWMKSNRYISDQDFAILRCEIECKEEELLDLNTVSGKRLLLQIERDTPKV